MAEFAIIGLIFFIILFSVMEFSRALFVWNAVADATRLGARAASVCIIDSDDIREITLSEPSGVSLLPAAITAADIEVRYLDENGAPVTNPDPANAASFNQIRYVEVSISNYVHDLLIPGIGTLTLPPFTTTRPRESLGIIPVEGVADATNQGC